MVGIKIIFWIFNLIIFVNLLKAQVSFDKHIVDNNTRGAGGLFCIDIDKDGDVDILAAGLQDNKIICFLNDGMTPVSWQKTIIGSGVVGAHSVTAADFDLDGNLDVAGAAYSGSPGIAVWKNSGSDPIIWEKLPVAQNFVNAHEIYSYDLDKDGDMDILGASSDLNSIAWWRNDSTDLLHWTEQVLGTNVTLAKSVCAGDLDNDGDEDILGVSIVLNDIYWWENQGGVPISWSRHTVDNNFIGAHRVQVIDMDDDGDLDILGAGYTGNQIAWWSNDGGSSSITWTKHLIKSNFEDACVAFGIDIDKDNDIDVIGSSQGDNLLTLWLNDGQNLIGWTEVAVDNNFFRVWPVFAADLDGDSDIDIVAGTSHNGNSEIRWYENNLVTKVEDKADLVPSEITLFQNYPNPFNPTTTIKFRLPHNGFTLVRVSDVLGRVVANVINERLTSGFHEYEFDASDFPSGVYFYSIIFENSIRICKKMILMK